MEKTAKQKMLDGEVYNARDPELKEGRREAFRRTREFNAVEAMRTPEYFAALRALFPNIHETAIVKPPVYCDYGEHVYLGEGTFVNYDCIFLDCGPIRLGRNCFVAPRVQFYNVNHPFDHVVRATGDEWSEPITVGDDCWIGGGAIICPGVTIGDRSVVGAGSVVTKDVPPDTLVAGNPARIIRKLTE